MLKHEIWIVVRDGAQATNSQVVDGSEIRTHMHRRNYRNPCMLDPARSMVFTLGTANVSLPGTDRALINTDSFDNFTELIQKIHRQRICTLKQSEHFSVSSFFRDS